MQWTKLWSKTVMSFYMQGRPFIISCPALISCTFQFVFTKSWNDFLW